MAEEEKLTKTEKPAFFERGKVLKIGAIVLAGVVLIGLIFGSGGAKKKQQPAANAATSVSAPDDFNYQRQQAAKAQALEIKSKTEPKTHPYTNTAAYGNGANEETEYYEAPSGNTVGTNLAYNTSGDTPTSNRNTYQEQGQANPEVTELEKAQVSSMIPTTEGSLFRNARNNQSAQAGQSGVEGGNSSVPVIQPPVPPSFSTGAGENGLGSLSDYLSSIPGMGGAGGGDYVSQNDQSGKGKFYKGGQDGSTLTNGSYISDDSIWTGTIIPGVLITGINTDLPGDVLARVTQNVYDSRTGKHLLIPQGSILTASYNSNISYAQSRVQIVWNMLIRPDGYQIPLGGMNGTDAEGFSGQEGAYHENWFQYAKAAGIIGLYSIANAKLAAVAGTPSTTTDSYDSEYSAQSLMNQMANNVISRALNIQPTITVDSGTEIKILTNKNISLPPLPNYPVTQSYVRR